MYCSSWLFFSSWSLAGAPRKSALVMKKLWTISGPRTKTSFSWTILHCLWKEKHGKSWWSVKTDIRKSILWTDARIQEVQIHSFCQHLCSNSIFCMVCPQTQTKEYLYSWEDAWPEERVWAGYTTFSIPGRGCCIGTDGSVLPACWASCKTGMLHSGHTFLTSNHFMRHLKQRSNGHKCTG